MLAELKTLGLLPGSNTYNVPSNWEGQPLWRTPPPGELHRRKPNELPKPDSFWLHPMFVCAPEMMLGPLLGSCKLPYRGDLHRRGKEERCWASMSSGWIRRWNDWHGRLWAVLYHG